ncbi:glycosyltransferase family 2 protein [Sphingomonas sp. CJ99]
MQRALAIASTTDFDVSEEGVSELELTILMPCLNEAETLALCIKKALAFLAEHEIAGEVLIADNGSTDGSQQIANAMGARVAHVPARGYGAALIGGIGAARGRYVIMGDADDSYDFSALGPFVQALRAGGELVMGNRFQGGIARGAMPPLHRYLGNPVLSFVGRLFFRSAIGDFHCGLRGFRRDAIQALGLRSSGMEFASEMVVKAVLHKLDIREVPTTLAPDGRSRPPHLRTWRDGWRHLRYLLTNAPRFLFLYPGALAFAGGAAATTVLAQGAVRLGAVELSATTMLFAAMLTLLGTQLLAFGVVARLYGVTAGLWPTSPSVIRFQRLFSLERGCQLGAAFMVAGLGWATALTVQWGAADFGPMDAERLLRSAIPATLLILLGLQLIFTSFLVGLVQPIAEDR